MRKSEILTYFRQAREESDYQTMKRIADALGLTPSAVHQWPDQLRGGYWWIQPTLEILTGGDLVCSLEDFYATKPRARPIPHLTRAPATADAA